MSDELEHELECLRDERCRYERSIEYGTILSRTVSTSYGAW